MFRLMPSCPTCGNKRCPSGTDHRLACTGSNEPGQPGSLYQPSAEDRVRDAESVSLDDDDYLDRPALGRTHPYGTGSV
jgi:hypothetical protein